MAEPKTAPVVAVKRDANDQELLDEEQKVMKELSEESIEETPETIQDKKPETPDSSSNADADAENEELSHLSARGQKRIQDLAEKAKQVDSLKAELEKLKQSVAPTLPKETPKEPPKEEKKYQLPWDAPKKDEGSEDVELTQEDIEKLADERARKAAREEIENERIAETLQSDVKASEDKYPEIRPSTDENPNPSYDQELVDLINSLYISEFNKNKSVRLASIVERVMAVRRKGTEEGKKQRDAIIQKQVAEQAIDPSGSQPQSDDSDTLEKEVLSAKSMKDLEKLEKKFTSN